jgi:hypothetical protein
MIKARIHNVVPVIPPELSWISESAYSLRPPVASSELARTEKPEQNAVGGRMKYVMLLGVSCGRFKIAIAFNH